MRLQPPTRSERADVPVRILGHAFLGMLALSISTLGCAHGLARDLSDETDLALEGETDGEDPAGSTTASSSTASGGGTTGGGSTSGGSTTSSSSSSTGGATTSGGTTSGGGSSSCDDSGTCDACGNCAIASYCQAEMNACDASQDCVAFGSCLSSCQDDVCFQGCETSYPGGEQIYLTWVTCILCTACYDDCDGASSGACL